MKTIVKIKPIRLAGLNNSEYTNFMSRTNALISKATKEALGIEEGVLAEFVENINKMTELLSHSYTSDSTAQLGNLDDERDVIVSYLLSEISNKRRSPFDNERAAAVSLYNLTKPYIGCQELPQQQETQQIVSMLQHLSHEPAATHVNILNLANTIEKLRTVNEGFDTLVDERTAEKVASKTDNSNVVRANMDKVYEYITIVAFAYSVSNASDASALFVKELNALITEVVGLNKLRLSARKQANSTSEEVGE